MRLICQNIQSVCRIKHQQVDKNEAILVILLKKRIDYKTDYSSQKTITTLHTQVRGYLSILKH